MLTKYPLAYFLDLSRGSKVRKCVMELEKTQWLPKKQILGIQNERLRRIIRYAYEHVPYYRGVFNERGIDPDKIRSQNDLEILPILSKRLIRKNFTSILAQGFPSKELVLIRTGGSTGEPLEFYSTREERFQWAFAKVKRTFGWWGYTPDDKRVQLMVRLPRMSKIVKIRRYLERVATYLVAEAAGEMPSFVAKLEKFKPQFISGYPSLIYLLARFLRNEGNDRICPKAIITHSEQLYDFQRSLFKEVFHCPTFSSYDSFEMNHIAAECPEHVGHHIATECVIVEIVDEKGQPVPTGKEGRILTTNLHNYAMPFIRYDTGDWGSISENDCRCGRSLPLISQISGRTTDYLVTKKGKKIPGLALDIQTFVSDSIEQFQIIQENTYKVRVKIVPSQNAFRDDINSICTCIVDKYKRILGEDIDISIELVDQILPTASGKRRIVVSNLPENEEKAW